MLQATIRCDLCNKELLIERASTPFGKACMVKDGKTKVWDTSNLFQHLCKECALTIDNELLNLKIELLKER